MYSNLRISSLEKKRKEKNTHTQQNADPPRLNTLENIIELEMEFPNFLLVLILHLYFILISRIRRLNFSLNCAH